MTHRFVSYLRVSTDRQGRSGPGLEAQRTAVAAHLNGGARTLLGEMVEVESGKATTDRPQLARVNGQKGALSGAFPVLRKALIYKGL